MPPELQLAAARMIAEGPGAATPEGCALTDLIMYLYSKKRERGKGVASDVGLH